MGFRSYFFLFISAFLLSGCKKEEMEIAEKVDLKVSFANQQVSLLFYIKPEYSLNAQHDFVFGDLSKVNVTFDPLESRSIVRIDIEASQESLLQPWPGGDFFQLPGGRSLPRLLESAHLRQWSCCYKEEIETSLYYPSSDDLSFGAGLYHQHIDSLEPGILIHQSFRNRSGRVLASLILIGPSDDEAGSLILVGHLGQNPFFELEAESLLTSDKIRMPVEDRLQTETLTESEVHFSRIEWFDWLWL